jgi:hypothetical protein
MIGGFCEGNRLFRALDALCILLPTTPCVSCSAAFSVSRGTGSSIYSQSVFVSSNKRLPTYQQSITFTVSTEILWPLLSSSWTYNISGYTGCHTVNNVGRPCLTRRPSSFFVWMVLTSTRYTVSLILINFCIPLHRPHHRLNKIVHAHWKALSSCVARVNKAIIQKHTRGNKLNTLSLSIFIHSSNTSSTSLPYLDFRALRELSMGSN